MIVPTMTVNEIYEEVFKDISTTKDKVKHFKEAFRKYVLSRKKYPVFQSYEYLTRDRKNRFFFHFHASKRSDWRAPFITLFSIYTRPEGKYAVSVNNDFKGLRIYPPHFFMRYRERILKDSLISNEDLIKAYFKDDWGYMGAFVNNDIEQVYKYHDNDDEVGGLNFVGATNAGYVFGVKQGYVDIVKTIISDEMLFENQKPHFRDLRNRFDSEVEKYIKGGNQINFFGSLANETMK